MSLTDPQVNVVRTAQMFMTTKLNGGVRPVFVQEARSMLESDDSEADA